VDVDGDVNMEDNTAEQRLSDDVEMNRHALENDRMYPRFSIMDHLIWMRVKEIFAEATTKISETHVARETLGK
jgi:hypothetical protein